MKLIELVRASQQILYCVFHFLEIEAVDDFEGMFDMDKLNEFIRGAAALVPTLHKNILDIDVEKLIEAKHGFANPNVDINLLKVSDLQSLLKHCRRIHNNLTL